MATCLLAALLLAFRGASKSSQQMHDALRGTWCVTYLAAVGDSQCMRQVEYLVRHAHAPERVAKSIDEPAPCELHALPFAPAKGVHTRQTRHAALQGHCRAHVSSTLLSITATFVRS